RRLVVGERPDDEALQPALRKVAPRRREQAAAKPQPLKFRAEVKLVDFAVVKKTACAIAAVIRITGNAIAELQQRDAAALGDGVLPPAGSAAADQLFQLGAGDDAAVGCPPGGVVGGRDQCGVGGLGAANLDE